MHIATYKITQENQDNPTMELFWNGTTLPLPDSVTGTRTAIGEYTCDIGLDILNVNNPEKLYLANGNGDKYSVTYSSTHEIFIVSYSVGGTALDGVLKLSELEIHV